MAAGEPPPSRPGDPTGALGQTASEALKLQQSDSREERQLRELQKRHLLSVLPLIEKQKQQLIVPGGGGQQQRQPGGENDFSKAMDRLERLAGQMAKSPALSSASSFPTTVNIPSAGGGQAASAAAAVDKSLYGLADEISERLRGAFDSLPDILGMVARRRYDEGEKPQVVGESVPTDPNRQAAYKVAEENSRAFDALDAALKAAAESGDRAKETIGGLSRVLDEAAESVKKEVDAYALRKDSGSGNSGSNPPPETYGLAHEGPAYDFAAPERADPDAAPLADARPRVYEVKDEQKHGSYLPPAFEDAQAAPERYGLTEEAEAAAAAAAEAAEATAAHNAEMEKLVAHMEAAKKLAQEEKEIRENSAKVTKWMAEEEAKTGRARWDAAQRLASSAPVIGGGLGGLVGAGRQAAAGAGQLGTAIVGSDKDNEDGGGKIANAMAGLGGLAGAAGAAVSALQGIVGAASSFVEKLNPGAVIGLSLAMRDFQATIGTALEPIVSAAAQFTREVAGALMPAMQALRPVFETLSSAVGSVVTTFAKVFSNVVQAISPMIKGFADVALSLAPLVEGMGVLVSAIVSTMRPAFELVGGLFSALAPLIKMVVDVMNLLNPLIEAFGVVMAGVSAVVRSVMGGLAKLFSGAEGAFKGARGAVEGFAKALVIGAAYVAKFVGATSFLDGMIDSLKKNDPAKAVLQSPQLGSYESFISQVTTAAQLNGPGGPGGKEDKQEKWKEELRKELIDIKTNQEKTLENVVEKIIDAIRKGVGDLLGANTQEAGAAISAAGGAFDLMTAPTLGLGILKKLIKG